MTLTPICDRARLAEFVDGELNGAERLAVAEHVTRCEACASEVEALRALGDRLRVEVPAGGFDRLEGLAGGVIARHRAERSISWRALFDRAVDGWQWLLVGSSALGAATATMLLLSALMQFGPAPSRSDSIAGYMAGSPEHINVLSSTEGALYITKAASGDVDSARRAMLVAYAELLAPGGIVRDPDSVSATDVELARKLFEAISLNLRPPHARPSVVPAQSDQTLPTAEVSIRFVTTTGVVAKGL
jgi:hypothetical protein